MINGLFVSSSIGPDSFGRRSIGLLLLQENIYDYGENGQKNEGQTNEEDIPINLTIEYRFFYQVQPCEPQCQKAKQE